MSEALTTRMHRFAIFAAIHGVIAAAAILGAFGSVGDLVVLATAVPLVFAWGPFQGHLALNAGMDEIERSRWRIAIWVLPWSMSAYWFRYVR